MLGLMVPTWFLSMWISNTVATSMIIPIIYTLMLGLMIPTWFLSMWISNTVATSMMIPIILQVNVGTDDTNMVSLYVDQ